MITHTNKNQNIIGSSETIRRTTYPFNFSNYLALQPQHKTTKNLQFLEWFIGFSEGDGSFIATTNNRRMFIINQKDGAILHQIRSELGFGSVSRYKNHSRYIVGDKTGIQRLQALFYNNLLLEKTRLRFHKWFGPGYKQDFLDSPLNHDRPQVDLRTSWLAGFIDAEGCFNAQQLVDKRYTLGFRIRLRFCLDQKDERDVLESILGALEKFQKIAAAGESSVKLKTGRLELRKLPTPLHPGGVVTPATRSAVESPAGDLRFFRRVCENPVENLGMWRLVISNATALNSLQKYLAVNPLRSLKRIACQRFFHLLRTLGAKKHLDSTPKAIRRLHTLVRNVNGATQVRPGPLWKS